MKYLVVFIATLFMVFSCQKNNKATAELNAESYCSNPGNKSFFPLIIGSVWYYADYIAGERDPSSVTKDSVINVSRTDTGTFATVVRIGQSGIDTLYYTVNNKGEVFKHITLAEPPDAFALLYPKVGAKIGGMTYDGHCAPKSSSPDECLQLEEYPYDSATTQTEKMKWQVMYFMRGIGLVLNGGDELVTKLEKYKIGEQELRRYE